VWRNPPVTWPELERRLSGRGPGRAASGHEDPWAPGDGGDSPAWSRKRLPYEPGALDRRRNATPYAELHCRSNFSFGCGASDPEELVEEAVRLGLEAVGLTDRNGLYGVVRFAEAARAYGLSTVFGAELIGVEPGTAGSDTGSSDADAADLVVLARGPEGYAQLARAISEAQLAGEKGAPRYSLAALADQAAGPARDQWVVLTGTASGAVPKALMAAGPQAGRRALDQLVEAFGSANVAVELWDHGDPLDSARNDALARLAVAAGVDAVAANDVHYHAPVKHRLATALAAVSERSSLDGVDGALPAAALAHLRSGDEQARRFVRYPGVVERAAEIGWECAFDLALVAPQLPPFPCPPGHDEMSWLRELVEHRASERYGSRRAERQPGAWEQIDHELDTIAALGFPGYFLVVWDIVEFCRKEDIYCQGRGSAANSAVCYALGITKADAVSLGLLFERFLSPERDGPPDIDIDIESGRREEVIQYVYDRYGRHHAAQVANVITYRARSAVRDMARALGYASGQQDAFAKGLSRWGGIEGEGNELPGDVSELALQLEHAPRHLGIHSGGMVICDRPIIEVCPVEWARMADRSVLQWDKDDCAAVGLVKFDLLGLGMLSALHLAVDLIEGHHDVTIDLAGLPQETEVYDMLSQMATLPRLRPRTFYDLVVEVALIRPGPIQGGSVHPYIRRRNGKEPVTYLHPLLENALSKTLGIPLFQEQLMQMAIDVAGFTAAEADELRQAMGSKRSQQRMENLRGRLYSGMGERGITGEVADAIWEKLAAFANFGFPESHSVSFAYLVYASAWIKHHYPAAFCAALINAQPMGFYSPHSLVQDARRHGVVVEHPCINASAATCTLIEAPSGGRSPGRGAATPGLRGLERPPEGITGLRGLERPPEGITGLRGLERPPEGITATGVRLGLASVRHVGDDLAERMEFSRRSDGPFTSIEDLRRRISPRQQVLEALATAGAFDCFDTDRRRMLWTAGAVAQAGNDRLAGIVTGAEAPQLPGMSEPELAQADLWATGISADGHPTRFLRDRLDEIGVVPASGLLTCPLGKVVVAGLVTHRQRPATAGGTTFINLEDETGLINVIVSKGCWLRFKKVAEGSPALVVRGRLERSEGVVNILAERLEPLAVHASLRSRDFR